MSTSSKKQENKKNDAVGYDDNNVKAVNTTRFQNLTEKFAGFMDKAIQGGINNSQHAQVQQAVDAGKKAVAKKNKKTKKAAPSK